jgi:hypothetical protein
METNKFEYKKPFKWEGVKPRGSANKFSIYRKRLQNAGGLQWRNDSIPWLTWGIYRSGAHSNPYYRGPLPPPSSEVTFMWIRITTSCVDDVYCWVQTCGRSDNKACKNPQINQLRHTPLARKECWAPSGSCQQQSHNGCSFGGWTNRLTPPSCSTQASSDGSPLRQKFFLYMNSGHNLT